MVGPLTALRAVGKYCRRTAMLRAHGQSGVEPDEARASARVLPGQGRAVDRESKTMLNIRLMPGAVVLGMMLVLPAMAQNAAGPVAPPRPAQKAEPRKKPAQPVEPAQAKDVAPANPAMAPTQNPQAQLPTVWGGVWKVSFGGRAYDLTLRDTAIGAVGGAVSGSLQTENMNCVASGAWYNSLLGIYPDGNAIGRIELMRLLTWSVNCPDGRKAQAEMFFTPNGRAIVAAAGRIQWLDATGKLLSLDMATLGR